MRTKALWLGLCWGCSGAPPTEAPPADSAATATGWVVPRAGVISLETSDGVTLAADYAPVDVQGAPGVVLVHMIPPANDRTNWPGTFVSQLNDAGYAVIAIDRRGAGDSEGVANEAYTGPNGKLDVDAAVGRLVVDGYGALALLGASNGTTSMIDYTVWAPGAGRPAPVALGFLTGGSYTEAQTAMAELPTLPAVFTYSTSERAWSEAQRPLDPGSWVFNEYPSGDHGTLMFTAAPEVADDLLDFLADAVPAGAQR